MSTDLCPICAIPLIDSGHAYGGEAKQIDCANCGKFEISGSALATMKSSIRENSHARAVLSHAVYRMQKIDEWPQISTSTIAKILENDYLPTPFEQGENLVLLVGERSTPGKHFKVHPLHSRAAVGSQTQEELQFVLQAMIEKQMLVRATGVPGEAADIRLTFDGWEYFQKLQRQSTESAPRIFMAMAYGNQVLASIVNNFFRSSAEQAGFTLNRLDDVPEAGLIDERMRVEIRRACCLISDLTDRNPGAYWEAGFAEGIGKPVIYTCETSVFDEVVHFDTNHHLTIRWDENSPEKAADQLKNSLRATLPHLAKMLDD